MSKKILIVVLALSIFLPIIAGAKNISSLKIRLASYGEINSFCHQPDGYDPISGCYFIDEGITIRNDLPLERFKWVFWHELGHFFLYQYPGGELQSAFNPTPQKLSQTMLQEIAADAFALWMLGGRVPEVQKNLFIKAILY